MHKNFGEWYRQVSVPCTDDSLKKRWAGVEDWVKSVRSADDALLETVRVFRDLPQKSSREAFLAAFRAHDAAFAQRKNELEQRVLAGAALVQCVLVDDEDDVDQVHAAILAGTAVDASRLRALDETLEELAGEVLAGLHQIARRQRRRSGFSAVLLGTKEESAIGKALEQLANAPDHVQVRTHVGAVLGTMLNAVHRSESALTAAAHDLRCADEETNILWWLAGGVSRDLSKPWSALKEAGPLVAGFELADLTDVALGPQDAAALLDRAFDQVKGKSKEQPLHAFVNAVPEEWAKARAAKLAERAIDLTPLSLALSHRSQSNSSAWQPFFDSNSGVKASITLTPERAAQLAYVEAMLFSTLAKTES